MDITNLRDNYPKLISHLERANYRKDYVRLFEREIKNILQLADSGIIFSYADVYHMYEQAGRTKSILYQKRTVIGAIEKFALLGQYPDGTCKQNYLLKGAYHHLCFEFKAIIDYYAEIATECGNKISTINSKKYNAASFFLSLQKSGINHLSDVTEESVFATFVAPNDRIIRHYGSKKGVKAVFKVCIPAYPACEKILSFLPAFKESRKNIQYLTEEEISKVKRVLSPDESSLTLRDKAIGILALYMGLRRSDIAGVKLDLVDFENDLLYICQQKTSVPLKLPLTAIVGNAIYDYIEVERPNTECEYLFISQKRPFGRISSSAINDIASKIMDVANIRPNDDDRRGTHIFRHRFATKLLANGVSQVVISDLTGHRSPSSLDDYLSADFPHLKECSLSIENFSMAQEVFTI